MTKIQQRNNLSIQQLIDYCCVVVWLGCWIAGVLGCWVVELLSCWVLFLGCWVVEQQQKGRPQQQQQ